MLTLTQVKYLGLVENLRVRRAGFAFRRPYGVFLERYKSLCADTWPQYKGDAKHGVARLCAHLYQQDEYRCVPFDWSAATLRAAQYGVLACSILW